MLLGPIHVRIAHTKKKLDRQVHADAGIVVSARPMNRLSSFKYTFWVRGSKKKEAVYAVHEASKQVGLLPMDIQLPHNRIEQYLPRPSVFCLAFEIINFYSMFQNIFTKVHLAW
jgi:hypothetical protein